MGARIRLRRLVPTAGALALFAGSAGSLHAQTAPPAQFPAGELATTPIEIEIYYGVNKVTPAAATEAVVESPSTHDAGRTAEAFLDTLRTFREGTNTVTTAAANLLNKVAERNAPAADSRHFILASYSTASPYPPLSDANAPWLVTRHNLPTLTAVPAATEAAAASPTFVVVREPASEAHPEPARGLFLSSENLIAFGVAAVAFLFGIMARARVVKSKRGEAIIAPEAAIDPNAVQLMGQYNAGPLPDTAEKFEIGPTFHEEVQQKKAIEEQNNVAAVEFILNQNLALLAAMNPVPVTVDPDGFALPENAETPDDDFELELRDALAAA